MNNLNKVWKKISKNITTQAQIHREGPINETRIITEIVMEQFGTKLRECSTKCSKHKRKKSTNDLFDEISTYFSNCNINSSGKDDDTLPNNKDASNTSQTGEDDEEEKEISEYLKNDIDRQNSLQFASLLLKEYLRKIKEEDEIITENLKLVLLSRNYVNVINGPKLIESEHNLLLAGQRRKLLSNQMERIEQLYSEYLYQIRVDNIKFVIKPKKSPISHHPDLLRSYESLSTITEEEKSAPPPFRYYYVCLINYGNEIKSTTIEETQEEFPSVIHFNDNNSLNCFKFSHILLNSQMIVKLYSMKVETNNSSSQDIKTVKKRKSSFRYVFKRYKKREKRKNNVNGPQIEYYMSKSGFRIISKNIIQISLCLDQYQIFTEHLKDGKFIVDLSVCLENPNKS